MPEPEVLQPAHNDISAEPVVEASESYERGLALRKAGLFRPAIEQFEQASTAPGLAMKAYAQIGLCYKSADRYEDAVTAFRNALNTSPGTSKDTVQILYVLGRTLESLGRYSETLEAYRWIRREDPGYRDVANRINHLSSQRNPAGSRRAATLQSESWIGDLLKSWQEVLKAKAPK